MKAAILGLTALCVVISYCVMIAGAVEIDDENLVLYLSLDDAGRPEDLSRSGSPIASYVEPAEVVEGIVGNAWRFDNSTCILLDHQTFNNGFQESTFSVCLKDPREDGIIYEEGGGTNGYAVTLVKANIQFATRNNSTQTTIEAEFPDDGDWHFVTTVFDLGAMRIYVDGELMAEELKVQGIGGHGNEMGIGKVNGGSSGGVSPKFVGIMDEFQITRRALSTKEVKAEYQEIIKRLAVEPVDKYCATWGHIKQPDESGQ